MGSSIFIFQCHHLKFDCNPVPVLAASCPTFFLPLQYHQFKFNYTPVLTASFPLPQIEPIISFFFLHRFKCKPRLLHSRHGYFFHFQTLPPPQLFFLFTILFLRIQRLQRIITSDSTTIFIIPHQHSWSSFFVFQCHHLKFDCTPLTASFPFFSPCADSNANHGFFTHATVTSSISIFFLSSLFFSVSTHPTAPTLHHSDSSKTLSIPHQHSWGPPVCISNIISSIPLQYSRLFNSNKFFPFNMLLISDYTKTQPTPTQRIPASSHSSPFNLQQSSHRLFPHFFSFSALQFESRYHSPKKIQTMASSPPTVFRLHHPRFTVSSFFFFTILFHAIPLSPTKWDHR
jgi:hypothetical protein